MFTCNPSEQQPVPRFSTQHFTKLNVATPSTANAAMPVIKKNEA
jgi:hypothetical protein